MLSLSPGPAKLHSLPFLQANANLWRISDDFWDEWRYLKQNFLLMQLWGGVGHPGASPDADMLPLGRIGIRAERGNDRMTRFTKDEQRTPMSLWSIFQAPLMFGGDLPSNDAFTLSLLTNDDVLAVDRKATGWCGRPTPSAKWGAPGLPSHCRLRDLWEQKDLGAIDGGYTFHVPPHGAGLYRLVPEYPE